MASTLCLAENASLARCEGRGTPCVFEVSPVPIFNCTCEDGWTGFGDFNPTSDNCDIYIPAVYLLGSIVLFNAVCILCIVYWAISQRTFSKFFDLLKKGNSTAWITVSALIVAVGQILWISLRLSAVEARVLGVDPSTTVFFGITIFFIYVNAPHVLSHYARLTFADTRVRMLDSEGRDRANRRAKWARPLVMFVLPFLSALSGFGTFISLRDRSLVKLGLQIMSVSTSVFLVFVLILVAILIRPMVRDMVLATSLNRLTGSEQQTLVSATKKLVVFQYLIVTTSLLYIPLMLVCAFIPELNGTVTYIFLLGALFCGWIVGLSVWTLTNVRPTGFSPFKLSRRILRVEREELGLVKKEPEPNQVVDINASSTLSPKLE